MSTLIIDGNNLLHRTLSNEGSLGGSHSIRMLYNNISTSQDFVLWVWDGYNSRARRQVLFPEYKNHRPEPSEDVYAMFKLFEQVLDHTTVTQIKVPGWEADDVIGTLSQYLQSEQGDSITVRTNDADYLQIVGVNLPEVTKPDFPASYIIAYKALCGDQTDNIGGMPRFGNGTWMNMREHWLEIDGALATGDFERWSAIPWPNRNRACLDRGNFDQCVMFYQIITFYPVPLSDIEANMRIGDGQFAEADRLLRNYHL